METEKSQFKRIAVGVIAVLLVASLSLIVLRLTGYASRNNDEIRIGWIGALTGDAAIVGQENLRGVRLAVENINEQGGINGKKVRLVAQDDQYDEKQSISAYRELVGIEGIDYILIETYGGFLALAKQSESDNVVLVNSIDSSEEFSDLSENAFSIGVYDESIGFAIADYLNEKNIERVGLIVNIDDAFPILTRDAFKQRYKGKTVGDAYGFNTNDFRSILTKLSDEDYIVLIGWEETGRIVKQARELGINAEILGIDTFASNDFRENTRGNYEGLIFAFWEGSENNPEYNYMIESYKDKYGKYPDNVLFAAAGYDSVSVLLNSIDKCDNGNVNCVVRELENTKNFQGAAGTITMDSDHVVRSIEESMFMYENGEIVGARN